MEMKTVNENDVKNPALKAAIEVVKNDNSKENQEAMFAEIIKAKLMAPIVLKPVTNKQGKVVGAPSVQFLLLNTQDGKSFFPLFTDIEEARKMKMDQANPNRGYSVRSISEYKNMINDPKNKSNGFVINPMSQNIILPIQLAKLLVEGKTPKDVSQAAPKPQQTQQPLGQIRFSEPQLYPTAIVNAVYDECLKQPKIQRVWLKQMFSNQGSAYAFILDCEENDTEVAKALSVVAQEAAKGKAVVFMNYTKQMDNTTLKDAVPMYDKELDFE